MRAIAKAYFVHVFPYQLGPSVLFYAVTALKIQISDGPDGNKRFKRRALNPKP